MITNAAGKSSDCAAPTAIYLSPCLLQVTVEAGESDPLLPATERFVNFLERTIWTTGTVFSGVPTWTV